MASRLTNEPSDTPTHEIGYRVVEEKHNKEQNIGTGDESEDDLETSSSESSSPLTFPYTSDELVTIISKFYTFLARLYLPTTAVKYPPVGGWPNITPEVTARFQKTSFVIELLRHLPYIADDNQQNRHRIHYKCNVVDYSADALPDLEIPKWVNLDPSMAPHSFILADGYESGGRIMALNTATGEIHVEIIRCNTEGSTDVCEYFAELQRQYEALEMVPIVGVEEIPEGLEESDGDEMLGVLLVEESDENKHSGGFPSCMDFRWVRYMYRNFGWPGPEFRKAQALTAVEAFKAVREGTADESQEDSVRLSVSTGVF